MKNRQINICIIISFLLISIISGIAFADTFSYSIQMGRFKALSNAEKLVASIKNSGFDAYAVKDGNYVVFFGAYSNKDEANKDLNNARKFISDAYIVKLKPSMIAQINEMKKESKTDDSLDDNKSTVASNSNKIEDQNITTNNISSEVYTQALVNDVFIQGVYGQSVLFFTVDKNIEKLQNIYIDLYFQHSPPEVKNLGSSITVLVNDFPTKSVFLDSYGDGEQLLRISIPASYLREGFNEIKFKTYHRITENICEDDMNPANWITLYGKSFVYFEYKSKIDNITLSSYPYPYAKSYRDVPVDFTFLYDESLSPEIIASMMNISSEIGRQIPFKNLSFRVSKAKYLEGGKNYIFIGTKIPAYLENFFTDLPKSKAFIAETHNTDNGKIMAIISENSSDLPKLALGLSNKNWINQIEGSLIEFKSESLALESESIKSPHFSLESLGYGNVTLEGTKSLSVQYFMNIPSDWKFDENSSLVLNLRYSKSIESDNSTTTLIINDIPIGSHILKSENSDEDTLTFKIPPNFKHSGSLNIQLKFYLEGDKNCLSEYASQKYWVFISNSSSLYLPHTLKSFDNLNSYPSPFVSNFSLQNTNFVVDKSYSDDDIELLLDLMGYMGKKTAIPSSANISIGDLASDKNNIIISSINGSVIDKISDRFNIKYNKDNKKYVSNTKFPILDSFNYKLSTIQLLSNSSSPFVDLVIAYGEDSSTFALKNYTSIAEFVQKLSGNTVFLNENGSYITYDTIERNEQELKIQPKDKPVTRVSYENTRNFLVFIAVLLVALVILIIIIATKKNKQL